MQAPAFLGAIYDGSSVLVTWQPAMNPGIGVTGFLVTVSGNDGSNYPATFAGGLTTIGRVSTGALQATVTYTVTVCAQAAGQPNACTPAYTLVIAQPVLTSVTYDATAVRFAWTPLSPTITTIVSYTISLFPTGGGFTTSITIDSPRAAAGVITLAAPLAGAYSVQVLANTDYGVSAATPVTGIDTALPAILSISNNGLAVSVGWMAPINPTVAVTGYTINVASPDGGPSFIGTAMNPGQTSIAIAIPMPLDASRTYIVTVRADCGAVVGSVASARALVPLPRLVSIDWDGTRLAAMWEPVPYPDPTTDSYQMRAYGVGGGQTVTQSIANAFATGGQIANPPFTNGIAYLFSSCAETALAEACSLPLTIFTTVPQIASVEFDGTRLAVTWNAFTPTQPAIAQVRLTASATGGRTFTTTIDDPTALAATLDLTGINRTLPYAVRLSAIASHGVSATSAPVTLVLAQPRLENATYDGVRVLASWEAPALLTATGYVIRLVARDGTHQQSPTIPPSETSGSLTIATPLSPDAGWTVCVVMQTTGASALSTPVAMIAVLPLLQTSDFDGATVTASWTPVLTSEPAITGYQLKTYSSQGGGTGITTIENAAATRGSVPIPGAATLAYVAQVCAVRGNVSGCSTALALQQASATISSLAYNGRSVTATWGAVADAAGYAVSIVSDGGTIAQTTVKGTTATLPVTLDSAQTFHVSVRAIAESATSCATGPAVTARIVTATPGITMVATSAAQVSITLDTTSTSGAGAVGYQASLYVGDRVVAGPTDAVTNAGVTTVTLTYAVQPQTEYTVRAWALGALLAKQPGPPTAPTRVVSATPVVSETTYDGTQVLASWTDVPQPGVTGYAVTIDDTTERTTLSTVYTNTCDASIAATLDLTHTYTVSVQAIGDAATGPSSGAANPLANSVGYFFPTSTVSQYPYLFRSDIRGPGPSDIILYLPALFATPPASITQDPFTLTKLANPTNPSLPYTLTVAQNATINVWSFDTSGIRSALRAAYLAFLKKVEDPANGLLPGAMAVLQQVIAQALPLTFAETLYYAYGYDASAGYVNLQPGMRLRVDFESRQFVSADPQGALSGFVGSGTSYFPIAALAGGGSTSLPTIFDAFLGRMSVPVVAANVGGGAGVIDLQGSRFQQPFLRLFYPSTFPSSDGSGVVGATQNIVIVGAPTIAKMEEATAAYLRNRNFSGVTDIFWTYFRGRATFIPELACSMDGTPLFVSLGTTVRQLTASIAPLPLGQASTVRRLLYRRPIGNVVNQPSEVSPVYAFGRSNVIHFSFRPATSYRYTGGLDCFDLPVLGGDVLALGG